MPLVEIEHSMQRAGYPLNVKPHAKPSMTRFDHGGYVGGGTLRGNSFLASGPGSATGPVHDGTFGTDFGGFRAHLGRVFLAPSYDPSSNGRPIYLAYRAETIRVTDVFALRPFRKAVLEKREDKEHGHGKEGGHGGGEHGKGEGKEGGH